MNGDAMARRCQNHEFEVSVKSIFSGFRKNIVHPNFY